MPYHSVFKPGLFNDQNIVVTGGGSGIGRCTAHELAALGAQIILVGRKLEKLQNVANEIIDDGGAASYFVCDIRDENAVKQMVADIIAKHQHIHGLVNNAGGQFPSPLVMINQKGFETVVRTNLVGGFLVAKEVFLQSMAKHGGAIVNMLADMWNGMPLMGHSGAARAGMENFTKTAAVEWAASGVRVNAVAPGYIVSSGMDTYDSSTQATLKTLKHSVPLKRMGTESEVSAAICFLLSEGSAFITGTTIRIDGGAPLGTGMYQLTDNQHPFEYNGFHRAIMPDVFKNEA